MSDIGRDTDTPITLLLRAIRSLDPDEQDLALAWLLSRVGEQAPESGWTPSVRGRQLDIDPEQIRALVAAHAKAYGQASLGDAQVVPVRFPVRQYERLKSWSTDNGFPIAAIVRGLVERFLDDQAA